MEFKTLHGLVQATSRTTVSTSRQTSESAFIKSQLSCFAGSVKTIKFLERSFEISGPTTWNSLLDPAKDACFIEVFTQVETINLFIWIMV